MLEIILNWDDYYYKLISKDMMVGSVLIFFEAITNVSDIIIASLILVWVFLLIAEGPKSRSVKKLSMIIVPIMITALITMILKIVIHRGAPTTLITPWLSISLLPERYVFPSGHTSRAFALAAIMAKLYPRWRVPLYCGAALIGFSRVYVGAHYPTDVIAGAILGTAVSLAYWRYVGKREA